MREGATTVTTETATVRDIRDSRPNRRRSGTGTVKGTTPPMNRNNASKYQYRATLTTKIPMRWTKG